MNALEHHFQMDVYFGRTSTPLPIGASNNKSMEYMIETSLEKELR